MRRSVIFGITFVVCLLLLVACGGNGSSEGKGIVTNPSVTATATQSPQAVTVTITDATIRASTTTFSANTPYTFTVTNQGKSPHDFIIGRATSNVKPTAQTGPQPTTPAALTTLYTVPATQLKPGAIVTFTYKFPTPTVQEVIQFSEHLAGPSATQGPTLPIQVR